MQVQPRNTTTTHLTLCCLVLQRQQGLQLDHNAITATRSAGKLYYGSQYIESKGAQLQLRNLDSLLQSVLTYGALGY